MSGAATNAPSAVNRETGAGAVYVDRAKGKDSWAGHSSRAGKGDGPKRTIRAGLAAALKGKGRVVVRRGAYAEGLDVRGSAVSVRMDGSVVLAAVAAVPERAPGAGAPTYAAPTGTVAFVTN
jgi:hypothetical protein